MDSSTLAFAGIALVLAVTPGADMALVTRNTVMRGRRAALMTTAGIAVACAVHAGASSVGLSAILAQSATAFSIVKLVGAVYLVWLGAATIWSTRQAAEVTVGRVVTAGEDAIAGETPDRARTRANRSFLEGVMTNLLNPKVALFYLMVLPQFVRPPNSVLGRSLALASIHIGIGVVWLFIYIMFVHRLRTVLTRPSVKAWVERVTGGVLLLLGLRLAMEKR